MAVNHQIEMEEHRLVRQVLLTCVKPTSVSTLADIPSLDIRAAIRIAADRVEGRDLGPLDVASLEEARNPTIKRSDQGAGQKMELAGTRPTHARAPPGAPSPVKLCQTYSRDAFRRRTKSKYRERCKNV